MPSYDLPDLCNNLKKIKIKYLFIVAETVNSISNKPSTPPSHKEERQENVRCLSAN
jgi:hypothetical protein